MLSTSATANTIDGASLLNPAERLSAAAHTVSSTPDTSSTSHATTHLRRRRLVVPGTTPLVRGAAGTDPPAGYGRGPPAARVGDRSDRADRPRTHVRPGTRTCPRAPVAEDAGFEPAR